MNHAKLPRISGIVPPVATPLTTGIEVDSEGFARVAGHLEAGGIDAAFVLGSTGELASLSQPNRRAAIRAAASAFSVPLLVGIGDNCLDETRSLAAAAAEAGAAAVVLNAPSYYEISAREMRAYLDRVVASLPLPLFLYNMPWLTGHRFDAETVRHALQYPSLIGFKDSSGDLDVLQMLIDEASARPETTVLTGSEYQFLDALKLGAHGVVGGGSNMYPQLFRRLLDAWDSGDAAAAERCQARLSALSHSILGLTGNPTSGFATIKAGLAALGLCGPVMAPPIEACSTELVAQIGELIRRPVAA